MNRIKWNILFDVRSMKGLFFVPVVGMVLCLLYFRSISHPTTNFDLALTVLEFLIAPLASWWIIFLFYEYYEGDAREVLFSCPVPFIFHGVNRVIIFWLIYVILLSVPLLYLDWANEGRILLPLFLQVVPQTFFFAGLAFLLMSLFKKADAAITLIAVYTATDYLTNGKMIPWYHVFYFNEHVLPAVVVFSKSIINLIIGILFLSVAHFFFKDVK